MLLPHANNATGFTYLDVRGCDFGKVVQVATILVADSVVTEQEMVQVVSVDHDPRVVQAEVRQQVRVVIHKRSQSTDPHL